MDEHHEYCELVIFKSVIKPKTYLIVNRDSGGGRAVTVTHTCIAQGLLVEVLEEENEAHLHIVKSIISAEFLSKTYTVLHLDEKP
jgi:hypothetical protein